MELAEIVNRLDQRIATLRTEVAALEAARRALDGGEGAGGQGPGRTRAGRAVAGRASARPGRRLTPPARRDPVPAEKVERVLAGPEALTTREIAERAGGEREQVLARLRELEASGRVRRQGERRGTRWRLFSEEDWIARRAAELAARSSTA
jgi:CRP-like cAMP-binding protein